MLYIAFVYKFLSIFCLLTIKNIMGVFGYADDLSLLCPSLEGLKNVIYL